LRQDASHAVSDAEGKFQFNYRLTDFGDAGEGRAWSYAKILAIKDGYGPASGWSRDFESSGKLAALLTQSLPEPVSNRKPGKPTLTLVLDDVPVRGRILNLEGRPVAGAKIEAVNISGGQDGTLDAWEKATKERGANYYSARRHLNGFTFGNSVNG